MYNLKEINMMGKKTITIKEIKKSLVLFSFIVVLQFHAFLVRGTEPVEFLKETETDYVFINKNSQLVISKNKYKLQLYRKDGKIQYAGKKPPLFLIDGQWTAVSKISKIVSKSDHKAILDARLQNGEKAIVEIENIKDTGFNVKIKCESSFVSAIKGVAVLNSIEEIYGFGEMWNGHVAQRGQSFDLWDRGGTPDECAYMPYYVSTNNYAFYLNYGGKVHFDVGKSNSTELVFQANIPVFDFTLISGNSLAQAVQNFQKITGMPYTPPRWAFEPWFWLMGDPDKPGADINTLKGEHFPEMIGKLKKLDIPVGVTWLEPPWQDARTSFIPNKEFCADLKGLIKKISDMGVKTLAWTVPYTTNTAVNWKEAVEKGYLVLKPAKKHEDETITITKSGELEGNYYTAIDFFNPDAAAWWQKQIEASIDLGFKGYKLDAGQDLPADALLYGGRIGKDVHNSYALEYNKVYYNALKNKLGDDFLMIPRAAWIGSSSFTNFKWPGDLAGDFASNGLSSSVYSSISLALSGMPFVSTDIGGFQDRPAPENVWIRWAQFGAFLPGMQTLHMPWWYSEKAVSHFRYLTWLHTDMIPFWESLAREATLSGTPIIRPLVWDYQNDIESWRIDDEFTVGNTILVAPVMNSNVERSVYLPKGKWYELCDESKMIKGPKKINWNKGWGKSLYKFPVYIRQGAIIPMEISNDVTGFGTVFSKGFITLAVWPKTEGESEFTLNDSEGPVVIQSRFSKDNRLIISWGKTNSNYIFRIHLEVDKASFSVNSDNKVTQKEFRSIESFRSSNVEGWFFNRAKNNLWIRQLNRNEEGQIQVNWNGK